MVPGLRSTPNRTKTENTTPVVYVIDDDESIPREEIRDLISCMDIMPCPRTTSDGPPRAQARDVVEDIGHSLRGEMTHPSRQRRATRSDAREALDGRSS